jgi:hypothetical protein
MVSQSFTDIGSTCWSLHHSDVGSGAHISEGWSEHGVWVFVYEYIRLLVQQPQRDKNMRWCPFLATMFSDQGKVIKELLLRHTHTHKNHGNWCSQAVSCCAHQAQYHLLPLLWVQLCGRWQWGSQLAKARLQQELEGSKVCNSVLGGPRKGHLIIFPAHGPYWLAMGTCFHPSPLTDSAEPKSTRIYTQTHTPYSFNREDRGSMHLQNIMDATIIHMMQRPKGKINILLHINDV